MKVPEIVTERMTKDHSPSTKEDFCQLIDNFLISESNSLMFNIDEIIFQVDKLKRSGYTHSITCINDICEVHTSDDVIKFVEKCTHTN